VTVTLEEMQGAREARFAEADANGDGCSTGTSFWPVP
jgi:hypothetical protein